MPVRRPVLRGKEVPPPRPVRLQRRDQGAAEGLGAALHGLAHARIRRLRVLGRDRQHAADETREQLPAANALRVGHGDDLLEPCQGRFALGIVRAALAARLHERVQHPRAVRVVAQEGARVEIGHTELCDERLELRQHAAVLLERAQRLEARDEGLDRRERLPVGPHALHEPLGAARGQPVAEEGAGRPLRLCRSAVLRREGGHRLEGNLGGQDGADGLRAVGQRGRLALRLVLRAVDAQRVVKVRVVRVRDGVGQRVFEAAVLRGRGRPPRPVRGEAHLLDLLHDGRLRRHRRRGARGHRLLKAVRERLEAEALEREARRVAAEHCVHRVREELRRARRRARRARFRRKDEVRREARHAEEAQHFLPELLVIGVGGEAQAEREQLRVRRAEHAGLEIFRERGHAPVADGGADPLRRIRRRERGAARLGPERHCQLDVAALREPAAHLLRGHLGVAEQVVHQVPAVGERHVPAELEHAAQEARRALRADATLEQPAQRARDGRGGAVVLHRQAKDAHV